MMPGRKHRLCDGLDMPAAGCAPFKVGVQSFGDDYGNYGELHVI
jgi:hypothetical protein